LIIRPTNDAILFWTLLLSAESLVKPWWNACSMLKPWHLLAFFHTKDAVRNLSTRDTICSERHAGTRAYQVSSCNGYLYRHIENLFKDFASRKFFRRDNIREVLMSASSDC